jgi:hypothetical protein
MTICTSSQWSKYSFLRPPHDTLAAWSFMDLHMWYSSTFKMHNSIHSRAIVFTSLLIGPTHLWIEVETTVFKTTW